MGGFPPAFGVVPDPYFTKQVNAYDRKGNFLGTQEADGSGVLGMVAVQSF